MIRFLATRLPPELHDQDLARAAEALSRVLRIKQPLEISLSFVTLQKIQLLNKAYRQKDRPTDVLSFSSREAGALPKEIQAQSPSWGDVVICPAYAKQEAKRRGLPLHEELVRLLVHGVLHLAGYDHATEAEELKMFRLQERLVEELTVAAYV